ncbi:MAG: hypothetical protein AB8V10_01890 [Francisella endosymbiont of Hyalomma asiaticum]
MLSQSLPVSAAKIALVISGVRGILLISILLEVLLLGLLCSSVGSGFEVNKPS